MDLLNRNEIEYKEIGYKDPLIKSFPRNNIETKDLNFSP